MKVLGIDPGINECAYCIIDSNENIIDAGLISNPYKTKGKIDTLTKITEMALILRAILEELPHVDITAIEATTAFAQGHRNIDTIARMAIASGCAFGSANTDSLLFVRPQQWKDKKDKIENQKIYMSKLNKNQKEALDLFLVDVPKEKEHNVIDALGIALWTLKNAAIN